MRYISTYYQWLIRTRRKKCISGISSVEVSSIEVYCKDCREALNISGERNINSKSAGIVRDTSNPIIARWKGDSDIRGKIHLLKVEGSGRDSKEVSCRVISLVPEDILQRHTEIACKDAFIDAAIVATDIIWLKSA